MSKFVPYPLFHDDMPIDISFVFESERPAGKHGFMHAAGDHFEFEDGTEARFWGVNFNGGACFPSHEYAETVADRLAKTGCNIVRFHQLDAEWDSPNIFSFSRGKRLGSTRELDPRSMERLDYLVYCLKERGIYSYLDMLTYRRYKTADGVAAAADMIDSTKYPFNCFDERMKELQKEFMSQLWNHMNPYTGLCYKDDPAFVMTEIINENDLFSKPNFTVEPYTSDFRRIFRAWLNRRGIEFDAEGCDLTAKDGVLAEFKTELEREYFAEMRDYMISIGVKIPITGTNWFFSDALTRAHVDMDFMDTHTYFYDWRWNDHCTMLNSLTDQEDCFYPNIINERIQDKPFFVSEWDMPWPNPCRAESPLLYAAVGSFQRWSGYAIHTYAYTTRLDRLDILGKEILPPTIDGVGYREGVFSVWNDPAKFGLFLHSALITRRADISPCTDSVTVHAGTGSSEAYRCAAEYKRVGISFEDGAPADKPLTDLSDGEIRSSDGQLYRSWTKHYGYINSPRTKAVYGRLAGAGEIKLDGMTVSATSKEGVIAISSLSDAPIAESDNLLITALCDAVNSDMQWDEDHMLSYGHAPVLVKVMEAKVSIRTAARMRIRSIGPEAQMTGELETSYEDGILTFTLGTQHPGMYYLATID